MSDTPNAADYRHIIARWKGRERLLEEFCNARLAAGSGCVSVARLGTQYPRRYWPRLAKRNVMIDSVTSLYETRREALAAADEYRQRCRLIRSAMDFFKGLDAASGTEAQRAATVKQGVVHDGPTGAAGDAHPLSRSS